MGNCLYQWGENGMLLKEIENLHDSFFNKSSKEN